MCLYPRIIKNRKYCSNKKNGGKIPPVTDERTKYVPIGCQNCIECRKQKSREWQARLLEDIKTNKNGKFITLTFTNENIKTIIRQIHVTNRNLQCANTLDGYELDNEIATYATRHFLERWRKKYKKSLRHWFITELGHQNTENIHLHGIIWTDKPLEIVENIWQYGWCWKGKRNTKTNKIENYVNGKTVNYIIKYVTKMDEIHPNYKSKILTSPGIGNNYKNTLEAKNNQYKKKNTKETYRTSNGYKISLPIYWRNQIYSEKEREQLWIQKLDKQERWVCGEKISIKNTEENYYKILTWHRHRNIALGYGTDAKNWTKIEYERQRRNLKIMERINASPARQLNMNTD